MKDITIKSLNKSFGDKAVLRDFNAAFRAGKITCIMGSSGCGKTTLLNILMGLINADSGEIIGIPDKISAVFQEDRLCEDFTAVSNIRAVTGKGVPVTEIEKHLTDLGLADSMYMPVNKLSGGMKRRVAIARAVLYNPELIILDEAFKGLDTATKKLTMDYLLKHAGDKIVGEGADNVNKMTGVSSQSDKDAGNKIIDIDKGTGVLSQSDRSEGIKIIDIDKRTGMSSQVVNSPVPLSPLSSLGKTVIAVTHDPEEAEYLGGRIIRLE